MLEGAALNCSSGKSFGRKRIVLLEPRRRRELPTRQPPKEPCLVGMGGVLANTRIRHRLPGGGQDLATVQEFVRRMLGRSEFKIKGFLRGG